MRNKIKYHNEATKKTRDHTRVEQSHLKLLLGYMKLNKYINEN